MGWALEPHGNDHCGLRDSGVYKVEDELDVKPHVEMFDVEPAVIYGGRYIDASIGSTISSIRVKRAASEVESDEAESVKPRKTARKARDDDVSNDDNITSSNEKPRVGCPFYKKDPKTHGQKMSCRGIGFAEMAKLKDHLKAVHLLKADVCKIDLDFKSKQFTSLRNIDLKWKLVFQKLFPEVREEDIPSPYSNDEYISTNQIAVEACNEDLGAFKTVLKNTFLEHCRIELLCGLSMLDFEAKFDNIFEEAIFEWKNAPILDAIKATTNHISDDMKIPERSAHTLAHESGSIKFAPFPFKPHLLCEGGDDNKMFNGLPMSPQVNRVNVDQHLTHIAWAQHHGNNAQALARNTTFPFPTLNTKPMEDSASDPALLGAWVYVPSVGTSDLDTTCVGQTHPQTQEWKFDPQVPSGRLTPRQSILSLHSKIWAHKAGLMGSVPTRSIPVETLGPYMGSEIPPRWDFYLCDDVDIDDAPSPIAPYLDNNFNFDDWIAVGASQPTSSAECYASEDEYSNDTWLHICTD